MHTAWSLLGGHELGIGHELGVALIFDADGSLVVVEQYSNDLLLAQDVQLGIVPAPQLRVKVPVRRILTPAVGPNILQPTFCSIVGVKILQVFQLMISELVSRLDESSFSFLCSVSTPRDVDWTVISVVLSFSKPVVRFELWNT